MVKYQSKICVAKDLNEVHIFRIICFSLVANISCFSLDEEFASPVRHMYITILDLLGTK